MVHHSVHERHQADSWITYRCKEVAALQAPTAYTQPEEYLALLLEYLADPMDNSFLLTAVRDHDGAVVALKSKGRVYPVIHNVPCTIPDLGKGRGGRQALWHELQDAAWRDYQGGDAGVFSAEEDPMGRGVGQIMSQTGAGLFLDVGCGPLPLPGYMTSSGGGISWIGIDPFFGGAARQYAFAQALSEYLPFRRQVFDGVLYAGVIDHVINPLRSLQGARSVIKPKGKLYIWYNRRGVDVRYVVWKIMRGLGFAWRYNRNHQWAFTHGSLRVLLKSTGFAAEEVIPLCEHYCPDYLSCPEPDEFLVVASCR